ncbi:RNA-directed DNA polymerase from mobile element jockey [Caerostris extrusa]|uniref:RNA-directed DNA polymerase from mobile element jockey n=1 Tax=Caerostris extrusa TaxID=172846 RepID=A0AAV4Y382_CAEEX|nr:RNA-directed DNA polymerase from mobile element jockey [Caerostris extrusa]
MIIGYFLLFLLIVKQRRDIYPCLSEDNNLHIFARNYSDVGKGGREEVESHKLNCFCHNKEYSENTPHSICPFPKPQIKNGQFPSTTINLPRSFKSTLINPVRSFSQDVSGHSTKIETTAPVSSIFTVENNKQNLDMLAPLSLLKELQTILAAFPKGNNLINFCNNTFTELIAPTTPTRFGFNSASTIDLALIKNFFYPFEIFSLPELKSDHNLIKIAFKFNYDIPSNYHTKKIDWLN